MAQFTHRHLLGRLLLPDDLTRILLHRKHLRLKPHTALKMLIRDVVDIAVVHDPLCAGPLRILRILDMGNLAVIAEYLQTDSRQPLLFRIIRARIDKAADLSFLDFLDDNMLLRLHARVAFDLIVDDVAVRRICTGNDMFVEENRSDAHDKAEQDGGGCNASETDAAGLHRGDLARRRQTAKRQETREQHGHRKRPHDNAGQTEHKDLDDRRQRRAVVRNILRNAKKRARADEDRRERTDSKKKGRKDLPENVFVKNPDLQMHEELSSDRFRK